jgi:hypothetical protein
MNGAFSLRRRCSECDYDFFPEPGFYLGAMMVSYLVTAILTIPTIIGLKLSGASMGTLLFVPFAQYLVIGPILLYYSRIIWLHLEAVTTGRPNSAPSDRVSS